MAIAAVPQSSGVLATRESFARIREILPIPNLIDVQTRSFQWFMDEGLKELFAEISPITDFTGKNLELHSSTTPSARRSTPSGSAASGT